MIINNKTDLKIAVRQGKYAWPGGYPLYFLTHSCETICPDCVRNNYRYESRKLKSGDSDRLAAIDAHWEGDPIICYECNAAIESAYGEVAA